MITLLVFVQMLGGVGHLMGPVGGAGSVPPPPTFYILTEANDPLTTEGGVRLDTEDAP